MRKGVARTPTKGRGQPSDTRDEARPGRSAAFLGNPLVGGRFTGDRVSGDPSDRAAQVQAQSLVSAFALLHVRALAVSLGTVAGVALFLVTVVLHIGAPADDARHLGSLVGLLGEYLPGYGVGWLGACVGLVWGWVLGAGVGTVLAVFLNGHHRLYLRIVERAAVRGSLLDG